MSEPASMKRAASLITVVVTAVLLVQTLVFAVVAVGKYWSTEKNLYHALDTTIQAAQQRLQNNLPTLLWNYNDSAIQQALRAEINSDYIEGIVIKVNGAIEYQLSQPWQAATSPSLTAVQRATLSTTDSVSITYRGDDGAGHVGDLLILPTDAKIQYELRRITLDMIIETVILNMSLAVFILLLLYRLVLKPINRTNKSLAQIADGGADLSKRLNEDAIGELGQLATSYNRVADYVSTMMAELEQALEKSEEVAQLKSEFLARGRSQLT